MTHLLRIAKEYMAPEKRLKKQNQMLVKFLNHL